MKEINAEYLDKIKADLGCAGIVILATDSQLPCLDMRSGVLCKNPHEVNLGMDGISPYHVMTILSDHFEDKLKHR